ncbi:hypothetical protein SVIOM74S_09309 [Streptomyces violarus]
MSWWASVGDECARPRRLPGRVQAGEELAFGALAGHDECGGAGFAQCGQERFVERAVEAPAVRRATTKCRPMSCAEETYGRKGARGCWPAAVRMS